MKRNVLFIFTLLFSFAIGLSSCKKTEPTPQPVVTTVATGKANASNEFLWTGTMTSSSPLAKVTLTTVGSTTPFLVDDSTAKNKTSYNFSYLITGITADTTVRMDAYAQNGTVTSLTIFISKF